MLVLSTTSQMMSVSSEIAGLLSEKCDEYQHMISDKKIKQLGLLTRASALLYSAAGCYVLSGILGVVFEPNNMLTWAGVMLYLGTGLLFVALTLLIIYAFKAVGLRKLQHQHNHKL